MPLIGQVGRKQTRVLIGITLIYAMLMIGGITMVVPFLITLSSAITNELDYERYQPFPRYLSDKSERYLKYLAEKYTPSRFEHFKAAYQCPEYWGSFRDITFEKDVINKFFPLYNCENDPSKLARLTRIAEDYNTFITRHYTSRALTEQLMPLFLNYNLPSYRDFLQNRYEQLYTESNTNNTRATGRPLELKALELMGRLRGDTYDSFFSMNFGTVANYPYDLPKWIPAQTTRHLDFIDWMRQLPANHKLPVTRHYLWTRFLLNKGWDSKKYKEVTGQTIASIYALNYPANTNTPTALSALRDEFESKYWPSRFVALKEDMRDKYLLFLQTRYPSLESFNKITGMSLTDWSQIPYSSAMPYPDDNVRAHEIKTAFADALCSAWRDYTETVPLSLKTMLSPEQVYQDFLLDKYGSLTGINSNYGWHYQSISEINLPIPESDYYQYITGAKEYFKKFLWFNFSQVIQYAATKGRALFNTVILVVLTMLATLTINPIAAYALSRFHMRATAKILLFLLATMAFPPEVAMIPSFLLLRDLGFLNTFAALILPGIANGFSIFLLKGFFDSLPKELYEAASIDGASEMRMFATITMPLCKPILAVIALRAFIAAYGSFMWAFLVCQNQDMWTLMVWLYQFQQTMAATPWLVMASLVLASIPTLIVFLSCQKIILRGIIIPTMK